jgi:hypothetical protein
MNQAFLKVLLAIVCSWGSANVIQLYTTAALRIGKLSPTCESFPVEFSHTILPAELVSELQILHSIAELLLHLLLLFCRALSLINPFLMIGAYYFG